MSIKKFGKKDVIYLGLVFVFAIATIVLSILLVVKNDSQQQMLYYEIKCNSFAVQNANLAQGQIVFIGDSITDGYLLDNYYADLPLAVYNRGIGGDTTDGVLGRLKVSLFDIKPSKVVLMIGTNDIDGGRNNDEILSNYRQILQQISINLPDAEVFCISIIPQNKKFEQSSGLDVDANNIKIQQVNQQIAFLADQFGYCYVDIYSDLIDENNLLFENCSDDGLHLNHNGYLIWTAKLKPYLD